LPNAVDSHKVRARSSSLQFLGSLL